jgi:hypothetical protein
MVGVPQGVPAKASDADSFARGFENLPLNDASVVSATGDVGREDKPLRTVTLPIDRNIGECRIKRDVIIGCFVFDFADSPVDDSLLNQHHPGVEVNVLPAEGQQFRDPHPDTHPQKRLGLETARNTAARQVP